MEADKDGDGKLSFEEFAEMVSNTVSCVLQWFMSAVLKPSWTGHREADDSRRPFLAYNFCHLFYLIVFLLAVHIHTIIALSVIYLTVGCDTHGLSTGEA